jgi:myo-inositol 2-dehydrogenase / D-chiro-inositol 1-dehydrogenase
METPNSRKEALSAHSYTLNRRSFLGAMLAAGAAPMILPCRLFGNEAPSNLLRIGLVGVGRQGRDLMNNALGAQRHTNSRLVSVCDVDMNRARHAQETILTRQNDTEISLYQDYREMLVSEKLDGVIIATPDFQHALPALAFARAGVGIFLEKPFTLTIREGQAIVKTVRDNKTVFQTGTQQRSQTRFHRACWLVRNGRIGKLKEVLVSMERPDSGRGSFNPTDPPENLNYDLWVGPSSYVPYSANRVHPHNGYGRPGWIQVEQYGRGMITNWGAHMLDIARWGIGPDFEAGNVEITAKGHFPDRGVYTVHTGFEGEAKLSNGLVIKSQMGAHQCRFIGEDGWIAVSRGGFSASNEDILRERPEGGIELATSTNHMRNFLECVRSGKDPIASVEEGQLSNNVCLLHWIAMKLGRKIVWNPKRQEIINDPEATQLMHYSYREGWSDPALA